LYAWRISCVALCRRPRFDQIWTLARQPRNTSVHLGYDRAERSIYLGYRVSLIDDESLRFTPFADAV
jgi:hypothetical protein